MLRITAIGSTTLPRLFDIFCPFASSTSSFTTTFRYGDASGFAAVRGARRGVVAARPAAASASPTPVAIASSE